jgi:hypothetical protein
VLETKQDIVKRLGRSTDDRDAFALTFAAPVAPVEEAYTYRQEYREPLGADAWMR